MPRLCVCVRVCACVCETERQTQTERAESNLELSSVGSEHVAVKGLARLVHRGLAPSPSVVAKRAALRGGEGEKTGVGRENKKIFVDSTTDASTRQIWRSTNY